MCLAEARLLPSMESVADPYDNAVTESFVATLKRKLLVGHSRRTWELIRRAFFELHRGLLQYKQ